MSWVVRSALVVLAILPTSLALAAMLGLGMHRHGTPLAVSTAAVLIVLLPVAMVGLSRTSERLLAVSGSALVWSCVLLLGLPVYFAGERRDAVDTGLSLLLGTQGWDELADSVADALPEEAGLAEPELLEAEIHALQPLAPGRDLADHEIALPYEGEGRNLSIPVAFRHQGELADLSMMLDTGATYTTLSTETLATLGIVPSDADPVIRLHTANGVREARIVRVDSVWLGDLELTDVAIATCDVCANGSTAGLLGLNVAGTFNIAIDADRREVTFSRRDNSDRRLDIKPFVDLDARFSRFPGGRVEVQVEVDHHGAFDIGELNVRVTCGESAWTIPVGSIPAGELVSRERKIPRHEGCDSYRIELAESYF